MWKAHLLGHIGIKETENMKKKSERKTHRGSMVVAKKIRTKCSSHGGKENHRLFWSARVGWDPESSEGWQKTEEEYDKGEQLLGS